MAAKPRILLSESVSLPVSAAVAGMALALHDLGFWSGEMVPSTVEGISSKFEAAASPGSQSGERVRELAADWTRKVESGDAEAVETLASLGISYKAELGYVANSRSFAGPGTGNPNDPNTYRSVSFNW